MDAKQVSDQRSPFEGRKDKKDKKNKYDKRYKKDKMANKGPKNQKSGPQPGASASSAKDVAVSSQQLQQDIANHLEDLRSSVMTSVPNTNERNSARPSHSGQKKAMHPSRAAIVEGSNWNFDVDYNDHFETPRIAYEDLQPALNALLTHLHVTTSSCTIYDPYFCQGQMVAHMQALGFHNVINMNRDFYRDVHSKAVPAHDILVTNPPYSGDHKTKLLEFLATNRSSGLNVAGVEGEEEPLSRKLRPFALLLPVYIATKSYWRSFVESSQQSGLQVLYLLPPVYYEYAHPEDTGKDLPPFYSAWLLGNLTPAMVQSITRAYASYQPANRPPVDYFSRALPAGLKPLRFNNLRVTSDIQDLVQLGLVTEKRPNPKQRQKKHQQQHQQHPLPSGAPPSAAASQASVAPSAATTTTNQPASKSKPKSKKKRNHQEANKTDVATSADGEPIKKKKRRY